MFPTIFHLGEQPVHWYPVLMAIAVIVGTAVVMYRGGQLGYDRAMLFDLLVVDGRWISRCKTDLIIVDFEAQYYNACFDLPQQMYPSTPLDVPDCARILRCGMVDCVLQQRHQWFVDRFGLFVGKAFRLYPSLIWRSPCWRSVSFSVESGV